MRIPGLIFCALMAAPASGDPWVSGPRGCTVLDIAGPGSTAGGLDGEHLVFDLATLEGLEYRCVFEAPFDPPSADGAIGLRLGYCTEPGPIVRPGVFSLLALDDNTAQLDGSDWVEPVILSKCGGW